jgi:FAD:protein FMN transferase
MSHWVADSDLSRFNRAPAASWQSLPSEFFEVLSSALEVAAQTSGAFDPTIGRLVEEWGFGPQGERPTAPSAATLSELKRSCDWSQIELDVPRRRARHVGNPSLDLSAIAKGFAVDRVAAALETLGVVSYLVEIGGELRARGLKQDHQPWWVAIEPSIEPFAAVLPQFRVALSGWCIATSGNYRRYFNKQDRYWGHTIDPRTGYALGNDIAQVSVIHESCMAADAYSTALMVLGQKQGLNLADRLGLAAVVVLRSADSIDVRCSEQFFRMTRES